MGRRLSLHEDFVSVKTVMGLEPFEVGQNYHEVASNLLKIGHRIAYSLALIATRGFCERQNSYGFRAI